MEVRKVLVVGAGQMGSGITQVFAQKELDVTMVDRDPRLVEKGLDFIASRLQRAVEKERISDANKTEILRRITPATTLTDGADADFALEVVTENEEIKREVFRQLDELLRPEVVLATNTSTISITSLAGVTRRADKVIGMHFFIPAPVMKLVEVIDGLKTSEATHNFVVDLARSAGKDSVTAPDYPGFTVNRLLVPQWNEAMFMVMEGAKPEDVDRGMKLGANHPMGPLELADFTGLDTVLSVMKVLYEGYGESKYRPCPLLRKMVAAGHYGRKSGRGFYQYDS